ncbi:hypothetical protein GQR58_007942 [Nymphon striatum]|nr:hypothetical protein GQR58_007942 [Nymphon striatum]
MPDELRPVSGIRPPLPPNFEGANVAENWKMFKQKWNNYFIITNLGVQTNEYQVALLCHTLGDQGLKLLNGFDFGTASLTVNLILAKFDEFAVGEVNETYERFIFNKRDQHSDEMFDAFLVAVRSLIKSCNYEPLSVDSLLRDRLVLGIRDKDTQRLLLREHKLTLTTCIGICRSNETASMQGSILCSEDSAINKVNFRPDNKTQSKECLFCGRRHPFLKSKCPAWGKTCNKCKKQNHFEAKCKLNRSVNQVGEQDGSDSDSAWIDNVYQINAVTKSDQILCKMKLNNQSITFQVDTGAAVNLIPLKYTSNCDIKPTSKMLKLWDDTPIKPLGVTRVSLLNPRTSKKFNVEFVVVEESLTPLLGLRASTAMNLVKINEKQMERVATVSVEDSFSDIFDGNLGKLPGIVGLKVDESIGVLAPTEQHTPWVNQMVITEKKNGDMRICLDPRDLNRALKREHFQLPILEDTLHNMTHSKVFSKLDLLSGYWHIELDENSSILTTFQTCFGRCATSKDDSLGQLMITINKGWPETKHLLPSVVLPYFDYRDELTVLDGLVLRGDRVIIPSSMRLEMKKRLHAGHLGINSCLRRARELVFWPRMSSEIRLYVESCSTCATFSDRQPPETLYFHDVPTQPWQKVGSDIFKFKDRSYLVTVDYHSNFFEVDYLSDTVADTVVRKLKQHFARHGIPDSFVSDGGPQYTSTVFKRFESTWNFAHEFSSPGNSKSNGLAEAAVKQAKRLLTKSCHSNEDPFLGLLNLRNTPTEHLDSSPAQRLFGRRTRTIMPTTSALLVPNSGNKHQNQTYYKERKRNNVANQMNQCRHDLKPLQPGDNVWIEPTQRGSSEWSPAIVSKQLKPRTYEIVGSSGNVLRRNRQQLRHKPSVVQPSLAPHKTPIKHVPAIDSPPATDSDLAMPTKSNPQETDSSPCSSEAICETDNTCCATRSGRISVPPKRLNL